MSKGQSTILGLVFVFVFLTFAATKLTVPSGREIVLKLVLLALMAALMTIASRF